jgi:hypothetical protein
MLAFKGRITCEDEDEVMRQSDVLDIIRSRDERGVFIRLNLKRKVRV